MDAVRRRQRSRTREPTLGVPALESMHLAPRFSRDMPEPYEGYPYRDPFLQDCQHFVSKSADLIPRIPPKANFRVRAPASAKPLVPVGGIRSKEDAQLQELTWNPSESEKQRKEMAAEMRKMQLAMEKLQGALTERESQLQAQQLLLQEREVALEKERKRSAQAVTAKEAFQYLLSLQETQLIQTTEAASAALGHLGQGQDQLRDQLRETEVLRVARDAALSSAKESERKVKSLTAEKGQLHEELSAAVRRQEQVRQDRDKLQEEVTGCYQLATWREEKQTGETRMSQLERELEAAQLNSERVQERLSSASAQLDTLRSELEEERRQAALVVAAKEKLKLELSQREASAHSSQGGS
ncbi:hypothetical protein AMELA_G00117680 [Ameiurus melas]|uniref:Myosin tail domain-containing protein n=1 Tax=Ameiurus melas TaxID=219545 RepID=A0A7J6AR80_AMEME|nr:hypothetical protein AMELA_G00117680 [Ameiurus melas]